MSSDNTELWVIHPDEEHGDSWDTLIGTPNRADAECAGYFVELRHNPENMDQFTGKLINKNGEPKEHFVVDKIDMLWACFDESFRKVW